LPLGKHSIEIRFTVEPFGDLKFTVEDSISAAADGLVRIPRSNSDNYSNEIIQERQNFVEQFSGVKLNHLTNYSFDHISHKGILRILPV